MERVQAEVVLEAKCLLGEGPVWWRGCLWFVDIEGRALHRFDPATGQLETLRVPGRIGFAAPTVQGDWLIAQDASLAVHRPDRNELQVVAEVEPVELGTRLNDAKCDPMGRLYLGTMHLDASSAAGALYRYDRSDQLLRVISGVTISNGLAWHEPSGTMYYIDTPSCRIDAYAWCAETGEIRDRCTVATLTNGAPDGMCIDTEGMLWVAMWGGSRVARIDPESGCEIGAVALPCENVTSCCFGGEKLDRLWITTARVGLDHAALDAQPLAGGLFVADVKATGLPATPVVYHDGAG